MKKINNVKITPFKTEFENKKYLHEELFPNNNPFPCIFISSKRNWGKTTLLMNILLKCATNKTNISWFWTTALNDQIFKAGYKKLTKYKIKINLYDWLEDQKIEKEKIEEDPNSKYYNQQSNEEQNEEQNEYENIIDRIYDELSNKVNNEFETLKKCKILYPLSIIIIDDMPNITRNKSIENLIKRARHLRCIIIISSQYIHDLSLACRSNLWYLILFSNISKKKLELIYNEFIHKFEFEDFLKIYYNATNEKYNFLYINCDNNELRKNFDIKYLL